MNSSFNRKSNGEELNLVNIEFKYIFKSYAKTRSSFTELQTILKESNSTNTAENSTSKSVSLSGTWILLLIIIFIAMLELKKNTKDRLHV